MTSPLISQFHDHPEAMNTLSSETLFDLDWAEVRELQFHLMKRRFEEMRPRIRVLDRLAEDLAIDSFARPEDATPLFLPHTMYKSYAASSIEKGNYEKMTTWLSGLTPHDLSQVDTSACDSLETWLDTLEANTPLRPICSSGTSGKISVFPRGQREADYKLNNFLQVHSGYRSEPDSGLTTGEVEYFCPWPVATGRHNMPAHFKALRETVFARHPERMHILGKGHWDVDMLWLSGRLRAAEAKGELGALKLTPALERIRDKLKIQQAGAQEDVEAFIEELFVGARGKRIFLQCPYGQMIPLAQEAKKRGLTAQFDANSYILAGGRSGSKGTVFPDDWFEQCKAAFDFPYQETYGMTESTGSARLCAGGHFHVSPWVAIFQLDPDTSAPLAQQGTQTGRLALFDTLPTSYWGGLITGDRVTINWDGGCSCGRNGPYVHNDVVRYSNLRDDDKVTCSKSPDAYEKAVELALGVIAD
jgi:hypothetical protein